MVLARPQCAARALTKTGQCDNIMDVSVCIVAFAVQ
jgi:hypothetical protein